VRYPLTIPPDLVQRAQNSLGVDPHGTRRAVLIGAGAAFTVSLILRVWMRLITEQEPRFSVGGTLFIFVVVTGFGAAAGYAFAVRHRHRGRIRHFFDRALAFLPMLSMGPFMVFFVGGALLAWLPGHMGMRRWLKWGLLSLGILVTLFWTIVFLGGGEERDPSLARALIYVVVAYALFVSLRFAFTRTEAEDPQYDPAVAGFAL